MALRGNLRRCSAGASSGRVYRFWPGRRWGAAGSFLGGRSLSHTHKHTQTAFSVVAVSLGEVEERERMSKEEEEEKVLLEGEAECAMER